ncbi:MAG: class I SAM-dependent methyltransferase [Cyanobacteria bacterium P01_F01_bin.13]
MQQGSDLSDMVVNQQYDTASPQKAKDAWRVRLAQDVLMGQGEMAGRLQQIGQAIAVGVLGKRALNDYMGKVYETHSAAYDPSHYQLDCEEKILPLLVKHHSHGQLLSAFCGQGREAKFFAEQGFDVTGIDDNKSMIDGAIAYARNAGFKARFELANFLDYAPESPYDVVYLSPWMYDTFPDPADRIQLLQQCATMLAPGGVVVISYVQLTKPERLWEKARHWLSVTAAALSGSDRRPRFGDRFYVGIFHHFFVPGELEAEVDTAGLQILDQQTSANGLFNFCILSGGAASCS